MDISYFFYAALVTVLVVQASAYEGTISINGDNVIKDNITISCSWVLSTNEKFLELRISNSSVFSDTVFYYTVFESGYYGQSDQNPSTFSIDNINITTQNVNMRISGLQCSDERNYYCIFKFGLSNSLIFSNQTKQLIIKVPPKSPSIRITPNISTDIMEQTDVSVTCNANLGRPGRGSIQWKISRGDNFQVIPSDDPSIIGKVNVTLLPQDDMCTQRVEETLRMRVNRMDQNLTIACFVSNLDFPRDQVPKVCGNSVTDLCNKAGPLRIVYGVNETSMSVIREPQGDIYQGGSVTLTCQAVGSPAPNYAWFKIADENTTASEVAASNTYQLLLTNLVASGDTDTYRCTANNTVLNVTYSASMDVHFLVVSTTTSTSTTTTTPITTATTAVAGQGATDQQSGSSDNSTNTIIIVVVVVGSVIIIAIVIGVVCWRIRSKKKIEEPSEKPYNNRTNLSFQNPQPDLVADKKFNSPSLDNANSKSSVSGSSPSFSEKKEDGLMYANLTYDNKPRSRKGMAINDTSSEYSDIQMPHV